MGIIFKQIFTVAFLQAKFGVGVRGEREGVSGTYESIFKGLEKRGSVSCSRNSNIVIVFHIQYL